MRFVLLIIVVAGSIMLGRVISSQYSERAKLLERLSTGARYIRINMINKKMTFEAALDAGGRAAGAHVFSRAAEAAGKDPRIAGEALAELATARDEAQRQSKEDRARTAEFIAALYEAAGDEQIDSAVGIFLRSNDAEAERAQKDAARRSRIARSLCALTGAAIAILLA